MALVSCLLAVVSSSAADTPDYSREAAVIQEMATKISFSADGAEDWRQKLAVRLQSEAAVRQYGVLSFTYRSAYEQIEVEYVRVRKVDGSMVETPSSSVMDVATEVATAAPTYSDLRQKQIPVKALGVGDVLEYSVRSHQEKPEVPGQFWYEQPFVDSMVVLHQSLEIRVPKDKYVQVSSPKLKSETHDEDDQRVYVWNHTHLDPSKPEKKEAPSADESPKVQITTFRNWEEVGNWWGLLASEQAQITPAIESKAKDLTAGLATDAEKAQAIYKYVAMKFRYISISLGAGRYRPHRAEEVFANQYGDCKDKHTLFVALLKAAGIQAWPALIGAGIKFDPSVPSPAQFNHVITVLPQDGKYVWLDTTAEVAPFGLLSQWIRDQEALVIATGSKPALMKTPMDPPLVVSESVDVKSSLTADGTLTGRFDFRISGDDAVAIRAGFHQLAPTQWQVLAQQMSYGLGFSGEVTGVEVESLDEIDKPLHYDYDYTRKNFSSWEEHKIAMPTPPLGFGSGDEADKPDEPFWAGAPGQLVYRASVQLPKGFSAELPQDITAIADFADYSAHYSFKDGVLVAERKMVIKKSKVALEQWTEYQKFYKKVRTDQNQLIAVSESSSTPKVMLSESNPEAQELIRKAYASMQARDLNAARDLLAQAERLNPKQLGLWAIRAYVDEVSSANQDQVITDFRKEIQYHPEETQVYPPFLALLTNAGRLDEAIQVSRDALALNPEDEFAAGRVAALLMGAKRYSEIPKVLEKAIVASPEKYNLQGIRAEALLRGGQKDQGLAQVENIAKATSDPDVLNNLAYALSDTETGVSIAQDLGDKAVRQTEDECGKLNLTSFEDPDLRRMGSLAAQWDTLGWAYFKKGDIAKAERYLDASWQLSQQADVADHLGQVYEKQGRHPDAIRMWRLAIASNSDQVDAKERLRKAGVPTFEPIPTRSTTKLTRVSAGEELGKLRTIKVAGLPKQTASGEFFLLVSQHGIEDVQFISGSDSLKDGGRAIQTAPFSFPFPDQGPEKIIRRGILYCSDYTMPSCQLTLLLPSTVRKGKHD